MHLKQHPAALKEYRKIAAGAPAKDQPTLNDFVRRAEPLPEKRTEALHKKLAAMVALDLQPYSVVEDRGFKELMAEAVPNIYHLPSPATLSRALVPRMYDDTRKKVKAELSSAFERGTTAVAFTSDMWTSRANESYVSFTCHFLTPTFQMKRFTLNTRHMAASHSAGNIAGLLDEMCNEWEICDDCQKYIITDNGRNIRAAVRRLPWTERSCFAHTLQLAIHDAISCTPSIDRLCNYKHSSSAQKGDFYPIRLFRTRHRDQSSICFPIAARGLSEACEKLLAFPRDATVLQLLYIQRPTNRTSHI